MNKSETVFGVDRSFDCRQRSKSSEPPLLTSKFLLSESVVNVILKKTIYTSLSIFPRHAQPSLLPVKEAVSVLSLHKASQPSNTLIYESELINRDSLQLTRGFNLKRHHGMKRHDRPNAPDDESDSGTTTCRRRVLTTVYDRHTGKKS